MPSYIADTNCQIRMPDDSIRFFDAGAVVRLPEDFEAPTVLRAIGVPQAKVATDSEDVPLLDFATASEDELLEADWDFDDAEAAMQEIFGKSLKPVSTKSELIEQILDIRFRRDPQL